MHSSLYEQLEMSQRANNDSNACAVKAIAAACDVSYERAARALQETGREKGDGANIPQISRAVRMFGFAMAPLPMQDFIEQNYPKGHRHLKSVTTHHPARFPGVFKKGKTYMIVVSSGRHIACIKDGVLIDWTEGRSFRCVKWGFYEVLNLRE